MNIDVTVIIPVYNSARTLQRAVYSTLRQQVNLEIIIIDDKSADNSIAIAKDLETRFDHIRILKLLENQGASAARNRGIEAARGKYIAFLDSDDIWLPGKLKAQKEVMDQDPDVSLVSCDNLQVSSQGVVMRRGHSYNHPVNGFDGWKTLLSYNFIPTPTVFARTAQIRQIGGFDESLVISEDLDLWIGLARLGKLHVLREVYVQYFDYSQSLMKTGIHHSYHNTIKMIEKHIAEEQNRLTLEQIDHILSTRNLNLGFDALIAGQEEHAQHYFDEAINHGYPAGLLKKRLFKRFVKRKLKNIRFKALNYFS